MEPLGPKSQVVQLCERLGRERRAREESGLALLEGVRLVEEALHSGVALEQVLWSEELTAKPRGEALLAELAAAGVKLTAVTPAALARAADTESPQGIVGLFRPRHWRLDELGPGLVLLLENLQDPGNLGTILRSMEALGGAGVVLAGGVDPYNPKVVRSAMGALFRLPLIRTSLAEAIGGLRGRPRGCNLLRGQTGDLLGDCRPVWVADLGGAHAPWQADLATDAVLIIGNEGNGPSPEAVAAADGVVTIPMPGPTESLNAGVAAALLLYEAMRQRTLR
ncbi:MAG TPA: RNA methyltransferase [Symbiobacteriaceae bacterium]|nr:RNA methyltransferase [Symbiobacteriaceae bacterium]